MGIWSVAALARRSLLDNDHAAVKDAVRFAEKGSEAAFFVNRAATAQPRYRTG
jgi:hypothetical protein